MVIAHHSTRRLLLAAGFATAVALAPAGVLFTVPGAAVADCPNGESTDTFTTQCVPDIVPNSPFRSIPGNPTLPEVNLPGAGNGAIPCTGANTGQCIGLGEEQQAEGPQPVPHATVGGSPTVTGSIG
jgi:hypothetical protein